MDGKGGGMGREGGGEGVGGRGRGSGREGWKVLGKTKNEI